jgi:hypothetical protein
MPTKKITTDEFIKKAIQIHGNVYDYSKTNYISGHDKILIICKKHGEFNQLACDHLRNRKCKLCANENKRLTTADFLKKSKIVHGNLYDYTKSIYSNKRKKIIITCKIHGDFIQCPNYHMNGGGCQKCANDNLKSNTEDFIFKAKKIHGNLYDYTKIKYKHSESKVIIICKIHGKFVQTPHTHINVKRGCPKCRKSKGEKRILSYLSNSNIHYVCEKKFKDCINPKTKFLLKYDFYIPSKNVLIEFDGIQHFKSGMVFGNYTTTNKDLEDTQYRDFIKDEYAKNNNIKLIRINHSQFKNIEKILKEHLL